MARPRVPAPRRRRAAAFTLLELLAVVLIVGLIAGLVLPGLGVTGDRGLDDRAGELAADLEFARQRSVMTGVRHRVVVDLDAGTWWVEWQREPPPPGGAETDAEPAPADRGPGRPPLDLSPPRAAPDAFHPIPDETGRSGRLDPELFFASVLTAEGPVERERVAVEFERDGTAEATEITLRSREGGAGRVLEVRPLADAVRVLHAS